mgnify:CR=1 FL=1
MSLVSFVNTCHTHGKNTNTAAVALNLPWHTSWPGLRATERPSSGHRLRQLVRYYPSGLQSQIRKHFFFFFFTHFMRLVSYCCCGMINCQAL